MFTKSYSLTSSSYETKARQSGMAALIDFKLIPSVVVDDYIMDLCCQIPDFSGSSTR